jgi:DNA-directed RNA polymerase specialized sigma24 family protein
MSAKQYLLQIKSIKMRMASMARQARALEGTLSALAPKLSMTPRSPSPDVHRMEGLIAAKVDLETSIAAGEKKLAEITQAINSLPDAMCVAVLTSRYVDGMGWLEIMNTLRISKSHLHRLHNKALESLEKWGLNETKWD